MGFHEYLEGYQHALSWWKEEEIAILLLAQLARRALAVPATQACSERLFSCVGNVKKTSTRVLFLAVWSAPTKISYRCFSNISSCLVEGTVGRRKIEFHYVRLQSIENYRYVQETRCIALIDKIYYMLATQHPGLSEGQAAASHG